MVEQKRTVVKIAGVVFSIANEESVSAIKLGESYQDFLCTEEPEVTIHIRYHGMPQIHLKDEDMVFDSGSLWSLYRADGRNIFVLKSPVSGSFPYCIAVFDSDLRRGEVYSSITEHNPLEYPLSEVLMMCLLAQGRGLMAHACGIDDGGRGYLFAGNSTDGKTTMARLWREEARILNDDRIVLRQRDGRFWMYGTPWHGDYSGVSPQGVPLEKIFFLRHADANSIHRLGGDAATASMLLTRSFPPLWDAAGMLFTLDFCSQLVGNVPCYELGFSIGESVAEFIRCVN